MKKICFLLLILSLVVAPVFAGGAKEKSTKTTWVGDPTKQENGGVASAYVSSSVRNFLNGTADIFDTVTALTCYSLTPFPNVLPGVENGVDTAGIVPADWTKRYDNTRNMIQAVFITLIVAEVLWTAIYKCWLCGDMAVAKQCALVFIKGLMMMFLVLALPTIVEYTRLGFQEAAYVISGEDKSTTYSELLSKKTDFQLPGDVVRNSIDVIEMLDSKNVGNANFDLSQVAADGVDDAFKPLIWVTIKVLYWIMQIIAIVCLFICSIHVMFNIIEVYLLIGIVCFLAPFSIFSLTKFLGERAILSLFVNMVELFVIMVILFSCTIMLETFTSSISKLFEESIATGISWDYALPMTNLGKGTEEEARISNLLDFLERNNAVADFKGFSSIDEYRASWATYDASYMDPSRINKEIKDKLKPAFHKAVDNFVVRGITNGAIPITPQDTIIGAKSVGGTIQYDKNKLAAFENKKYQKDKDLFTQLSAQTQIRAFEKLIAYYPYYTDFIVLGYTSTINTDIVPVHICSCLLAIFIQFYFLGQSARITNALMSGTAATDGFTGAQMKMAAGKAVGAAVGVGAMVAGAPVRAVGATIGTILSSRGGIISHIMRNAPK